MALLPLALVLLATLLLILGLLQDSGLLLIYLSIASSLAAGILWVYATLRPRRPAGSADEEPEPIPHPATDAGERADDGADDPGGADVFPIADYDELTAEQILPILPQLYADEIDVVRRRELEVAARPEVLTRLDELADLLRDAPPDATGAGLTP